MTYSRPSAEFRAGRDGHYRIVDRSADDVFFVPTFAPYRTTPYHIDARAVLLAQIENREKNLDAEMDLSYRAATIFQVIDT